MARRRSKGRRQSGCIGSLLLGVIVFPVVFIREIVKHNGGGRKRRRYR